MGVAIVEAREPGLREEIFRFRYDIYVREMGRPQKDADHARGRIEDGLDAFAFLLAAVDQATTLVAGTVRTNLLRDGDIGAYREIYGLANLSAAARGTSSVTTRLMVERTKRGSAMAVRLASALYAFGLRHGVDADYIDCNPHRVPFFEHLGYRTLRTIDHPDYGDVTLMRLDLRDLAHLQRVKSPFVAVHDRDSDLGGQPSVPALITPALTADGDH
jgi:hypothetical protein